MRYGLLGRFLLVTIAVSGCGAAPKGPEPTAVLDRPAREKKPFAEFAVNLSLTAAIERDAIRKPRLKDSVSAQIDAMVAYVKQHGRGEIEEAALHGPPRPEGDYAGVQADPELWRLGNAALALFQYLRIDWGPAELSGVALQALRQRLGRDAEIRPLGGESVQGEGSFTPAFREEVAYLHIRALEDDVAGRVLGVLGQWSDSDHKPRAVVVDLSDCDVANPTPAAGIFNALAPGRIALGLVFRDPNTGDLTRRAWAGAAYESGYARTPVFVVTSKKTAPIAEALAFALREHRGALVLGDKTEGSGRYMDWYRISPRELFGFTVADVVATDGHPLAGRAIVPDACPNPRGGVQALSERTEDTYRKECTAGGQELRQDEVIDFVLSRLPLERGSSRPLEHGEEHGDVDSHGDGAVAALREGVSDRHLDRD